MLDQRHNQGVGPAAFHSRLAHPRQFFQAAAHVFEIDGKEGAAHLPFGHQPDLRFRHMRRRRFHLNGMQGKPRLRRHPVDPAIGQQAQRAPGQHTSELAHGVGGEFGGSAHASVCSRICMHKASKSRPATRAAIGTRLWSVMPGEVFASSK